MQILGMVLVGLGIFLLGRAYEAHKLRAEWELLAQEWEDLPCYRWRK